jgi:hypothetical protein
MEESMSQKLVNTILGRIQASEDYLVNKRDAWDEYEGIFLNKVSDNISATTKNVISDPILATMAIERSNRVMAQLPTGKVKMMSRNDQGGALLMNMILDKWVVPNANAQWDLLTKYRLVDQYSNIYGNFFAFVDWEIKNNGYIGPDLWLLNIRDVFPQVGAVSLEDSDYVIVRTWKNKSYFEDLAKDDFKGAAENWNKMKDMSGEKANKDSDEKSRRDYDYPDPVVANGSGQFSVYSMYERDRWVDYVPATHTILRDIDNPHENEELPVVCKYSIPLLDDFMGMGDFERGKSMQYGLNGLWNLYMSALRISIFPPTLINKDAIAAAHTMKFGPAEKWLVRGTPLNAVSPMPVSPQGLQTFQTSRQIMVGSLLNQFGTTFTESSSSTNAEMGKTPEALKMQQMRENTRDNADRFYMEQFLKKVMNRFVNLIAKKQPKALNLRLFPEEINELTKQYPEMNEQYNERTGKLTIKKGSFANCIFDYDIVSGSTYKADQADEQANLRAIFQLVTNELQMMPTGEISSPIIERLKQEGRDVSISELFTKILTNSGVQDWDKIIPDLTNGNKDQYQNDMAMQQHAQMLEQALSQAAQPLDQINQIPPQEGMNVPGNQVGQF